MPITGTSIRGISASVDGGGDRLEDDREAARRLQGERVPRDLRRRLRVRPWVLKPPSGAGRCGVRPTCPITGIPERDDGLRPLHRGPAPLQLDGVAARLPDEPLRVVDRVLVGALIGAEWQVADQKRRAQAAADGGGHGHHLVHPDRGRGVVAEHHHGRGVAHQHESTPASSAT